MSQRTQLQYMSPVCPNDLKVLKRMSGTEYRDRVKIAGWEFLREDSKSEFMTVVRFSNKIEKSLSGWAG